MFFIFEHRASCAEDSEKREQRSSFGWGNQMSLTLEADFSKFGHASNKFPRLLRKFFDGY
jgi:hypothetical protein